MADETARTKGMIYALVGTGFAGLIGAHEVTAWMPQAADDSNAFAPFLLAAAGTLSFIVAGVLAFRLLRQGR